MKDYLLKNCIYNRIHTFKINQSAIVDTCYDSKY